MKNKTYSTVCALFATFVVYLDLVLKTILNKAKMSSAAGDEWWFIVLLVGCLLTWLNVALDEPDKKFLIFILVWISFPVIIFAIYLFASKDHWVYSYKPVSTIYIFSEIILYVPIFYIYIKRLIIKSKN